MYEIFHFIRDDWGQITQVKYGSSKTDLKKAIKICKRLPTNSFVKKYGTTVPIFINNPELQHD